MISLTHPSQSRKTPCCSPSAAWVWVNAIAEMALGGEVAPHVLAGACDHALKMIRAAGVPR